MEMQFKNEIKKLADIVVWADNGIEEMRMDLSSLTEEEFKNLDAVKDLEAVKKVVLESMERHAVYTSALNKDLADKAAKIELLEKEIEGRKEGYYALKDKMTDLEETLEIRTKENRSLIKANEKLEKESEKWQDLAKMNRDTISDQYGVCEDFKNKIAELEEMTRYWESQYEYVLKCRKEDIEDLEGRLKEEIDLVCSAEERLIELQKENEELENTVKRLNKELNETCTKEESIHYYKNQERIRTDQLRATERKVEELWKEIEKMEDDDYGKSGFKRYIEHLIEEEERAIPERFKERLNKEITEIFTKEEETKIKGNGRTSSGRYPWGAKVNGIPCGEDSIE